MTNQAPHIPRFKLLVGSSGLVALLALITWLFLKADAVSPHAHYTYLGKLRALRQADVELDAVLLATRTGLLHNYDSLARKLKAVEDGLHSIAEPPDFLPPASRGELTAKIAALASAHQVKARLIDRFRRSHAVLRNSYHYFPAAAERFLEENAAQRALSTKVERFVRAILAFARYRGADPTPDLERQAQELAGLQLPASQHQAMTNLLVHARVIMERQPEVDDLARRILEQPTAARHEELTRLYNRSHEQAQRLADRYRHFLYGVALLLAIYLLWAFLRIEQDKRALAASHHELSERHEALRAAEQRLRLYATVFSNAREGMLITDAATRIIAVNPSFAAITGYDESEVIGQTPAALLKSGHHTAAYYREMWEKLETQGFWEGEIHNRRKDGTIYPEWLSISTVREETGRISHYIGIFSDLTERKKAEERILYLSQHDALTGLPNRLLLDDRIAQAMLKANHDGRPMAVLFINLDRFKNINETLGHAFGDELLVQVAHRIRAALWETDTVVRHGGDAFVVVLSGLQQAQDASLVARKLLQTLARPYLLAGHSLTVTASIGIAIYPEDGRDVSELLRKAEAAMDHAKEAGRNTYRFYAENMNIATLDMLMLETHLRKALDQGELSVYYQPKIDAQSGALVGAEALLHWQHPEQGMIPPSRFVPLAEECGLIAALGDWVLKAVCRQLRLWIEAGLTPIPVAVNVSPRQFTQQDIVQTVAAALAAHEIAPELIEIEITESLLVKNAEQTAMTLKALHAMGIRLAIDDFGTGYSSLSYLKQLPVQVLKVDRSFVSDIDAQDVPFKIAAAIIAIGRSMDLTIVAEGVETETQRRYLFEHGCNVFQGYLFDPPLPTEEFTQRLKNCGSYGFRVGHGSGV